MCDMLEWRPIKGFEGRYEVSNEGQIKSLLGRSTEARILKPHLDKKGYLTVALCGKSVDGRFVIKRAFVHILVANAFLPPDPTRPVIDHINCNKQDNRPENLRRCTTLENNNNPITMKRKLQGILRSCTTQEFREKCSLAAAPRKRRVRCLETGIIYESLASAARSTGRSLATVQESCRNAALPIKRKQGAINGRPVLHFEFVNTYNLPTEGKIK